NRGVEVIGALSATLRRFGGGRRSLRNLLPSQGLVSVHGVEFGHQKTPASSEEDNHGHQPDPRARPSPCERAWRQSRIGGGAEGRRLRTPGGKAPGNRLAAHSGRDPGDARATFELTLSAATLGRTDRRQPGALRLDANERRAAPDDESLMIDIWQRG